MSTIVGEDGSPSVLSAADIDTPCERHRKLDKAQSFEENRKSLSVAGAGKEENHAEQDFVLQRTRTYGAEQGSEITPKAWLSRYSSRSLNRAQSRGSLEFLSEKGPHSLQLPSFVSLGISSINRIPRSIVAETTSPQLRPRETTTTLEARTIISNLKSTDISFCSGIPPLTPPPEDTTLPNLDFLSQTPQSGSIVCSATSPKSPAPQSDQTSTPSSQKVENIIMPEPSEAISSSQVRSAPWTSRASRKMLNALNSATQREGTSVVSQTLPCQGKDSRAHPTFEQILEDLQTDPETPPYITITHAVPQARVMDELPKTPPSTPGPRHDSSDYFGNDQTIFTHAAVVPIYHSHERVNIDPTNRIAHRIAAPSSVQVSILERYIPPSMPEEINDFFNVSARSYLSDRLSELSANKGSLLLIYPTHEGGSTFARQYVGPVIDPCLRRFVMLNGLTSDAASRMGKMTAVDHMIDFDEMKTRISSLCQTLTARPAARGPRSAFNITHSETAKIVLERATWMDWFVEQEQSRFKQNLVEYHQAGGRMPEAESFREVTVGMLTRDFVASIQKSKDQAGGAEIEVGVFLITRSVSQ